MKKINKFFSLIAAAALVMTAVTGCGGNTGTNDSAAGTDTVGDTDTQTTNAADTTDGNSAAADDTATADGPAFMIGGIGPLTGANAVYGLGVQTGAQIAIDEINAAGGVNGVQLQFNMQDDETDPEKAVNAYNTLKDWGMNILMGTVTSGCCVEVAGKTMTDNMFQLTPSGSSVSVIENNDNVFQVCFTDPNQGIGSAQYIEQNQIAKSAAVIYDSSDVYSTGIYEKFVEEAGKSSNFTIVATEAFTADSKTDFSVQLQKAKDAGADLVFLPIYYNEASLILTQAAGMEYAPIFFGCDGLDGILGVENFDTALAEDVVLLTPFAADAEDALTKAFVAEYQSRTGEIPNQFAADAYDAIYAIKASIEQSNVTPDMSISDICEGLKTGITQISIDGLTGSGMTWVASGEVNKAPKAMKIVDGAYQLIQ